MELESRNRLRFGVTALLSAGRRDRRYRSFPSGVILVLFFFVVEIYFVIFFSRFRAPFLIFKKNLISLPFV